MSYFSKNKKLLQKRAGNPMFKPMETVGGSRNHFIQAQNFSMYETKR